MDILKTALTSLLSISTLFAITKFMGHRQIAQLDIFDYINGITIGSIAAELATDIETPLKPLTAMIIYGLLGIGLNTVISKWARSRKYVNGTPTILLNNGKLYRENLKKAKLDLSEFLVICRQSGYFDLGAIQTAVFEFSGKITFLPVSSRRPATPDDMGLSPAKETIFAEVIMDGRILDSNLKRMGKNLRWLEKQLDAQGYSSAKDIFLAVCDEAGHLSLYPMDS